MNAYPRGNPRITWLGYRKDLGTLPAIDRYYTPEFAQDDDGTEIQALRPTPDCRVIAANRDGQVWNLMSGNLQVISKDARNKTGWRPDRPVLDGKDHRYDYATFMRETLGVDSIPCQVDAFTFVEGDERVTVLALPPEIEKTVRIGDQFPAWRVDAVGNPLPGRTLAPVTVTLRNIPAGSSATYAGGTPIEIPQGDRWKWIELRGDHGWDRDFWWTRKVGGEGRIFIDGFMDLGGMTVRQSYVGVRSVRMRAGEQPRRFSARPVAVTPGERISFGGWARTEMVHAKADVRLRFLDADGRQIAVSAAPALQGDTHWQETGAAGVPVTDRARSAVLDRRVQDGRTEPQRFGRNWHDTAWFDDLYIYRAPE